jgi:hypothetical protein
MNVLIAVLVLAATPKTQPITRVTAKVNCEDSTGVRTEYYITNEGAATKAKDGSIVVWNMKSDDPNILAFYRLEHINEKDELAGFVIHHFALRMDSTGQSTVMRTYTDPDRKSEVTLRNADCEVIRKPNLSMEN